MALLAFCLKASCGTVITVSVRAGILSEGSTGKNQLPESLMWLLSGFSSLQVVGLGPQFLTGHGLEATLRSLPRGPLCRAAHSMAAGLLREDRQDGGDHEEDQGHSLCNLIVDEPLYLCCLFSALSKSPREVMTEGMDIRRHEHHGAIGETCAVGNIECAQPGP